MTHTLDNLPFNNRFSTLGDAFFARVSPTPLEKPFLIHINEQAAELIDLSIGDSTDASEKADFLDYFSGTKTFAQGDPLAMLYSGHQFGQYVPQLGDGRAVMLGEVKTDNGGWELQLKGSGQTPFSRNADGRAVLRSTIREYLCSEAMHGLGIPTTRALCMVGSQEEVHREKLEFAAMMVRMAPSHVRFGSFEVFFHRRQHDLLKQLADFMLEQHFADCLHENEPYLAFLQEVVTRTAKLMAQWQLVGFAHGVMNTDNMSVLGLTLDYGPFGFLDIYNPGFICNHSDYQGRYAFHQQPQIGLWNLNQFAQTLLPLLQPDEPELAVEKAKTVLQTYQTSYHQAFNKGMNAKLGLVQDRDEDPALAESLLEIMAASNVDYSLFFRRLAELQCDTSAGDTSIRDLFMDREAFDHWAVKYRQRLQEEGSDDGKRKQAMNRVNPKYILRNYMAQIAIEKADANDFSEIEKLMTILQAPFDEHPEMEIYAGYPPAWAEQISVSCSS